MTGVMHQFNLRWFDEYPDWLEYNVSLDAAFCLPCFLFKDVHQRGEDVFFTRGFQSWNKKNRFGIHVGGSNSDHCKAKKKCEDLMQQIKMEYRIRLTASVKVVRFLLGQGLAFRGHDESVSSSNKAPKNNQLTCPTVQKKIIRACAIETAKAIIKDLNDDYFNILVDESHDISYKKQMALVLRYVDRRGFVMERFIGILHIRDTSALSLKETIASLLAQHSLSISYIRGQCYDGSNNMQGKFNGLKALIQRENSKKCDKVARVVNLVSTVLNVVGASFKNRDEFRDAQILKIQKALEMGELQTGRGLNQELGLARPSDTRWRFHFKSFVNFILLFDTIIDVLDTVGMNTESLDKRWKARGFLDACLKFEFEQDIVNAMLLVGVAKKRLQMTRDKGWDSLIDDVSAFCIKHDIEIPRFDSFYVFRGKSKRKVADYSVLHHYRVEVFCKVIDWQLQELNNRFNESFANFDIEKIMRLVALYPDDFKEYDLVELRHQLENYIVDVGYEDIRFNGLNGIGDLSKKLVETKKHLVYSHVYQLVEFSLLLSVATASVERPFSTMKFIKTDLWNRMEDDFLNDCLITYKERDVFMSISDDDIMTTFQNMKTRRGRLD
ncbi:hypothetical protein CDL12_15243 [Handroanthus impetiginosus]|uniref:TTF-type domain-containing protein n=1 Tax=Handroanthus impetiginosus TaxID=429701 RepID=A0A2G9H3R0_9LAMI|nr:hypothetical protein CDL12_15243 [Handroanthus impetiginosus]